MARVARGVIGFWKLYADDIRAFPGEMRMEFFGVLFAAEAALGVEHDVVSFPQRRPA
jgi:hypothetical protein